MNFSYYSYGTTFVSEERRFAFHPKEAILSAALVSDRGTSVFFMVGQNHSAPLSQWTKEERTLETKATLQCLEWSVITKESILNFLSKASIKEWY